MKKKKLIVVGDRVFIEPLGESKTGVGLFLPESAIRSNPVQLGRVAAVGPGIPIGADRTDSDEPWKQEASMTIPKYFPVQTKVGDVVTFFRRAAVEVQWEKKDYLVVPHGAILLIERDAAEVIEPGEFEEGSHVEG
jgi:co-chaperonin GroES (HSP10)